MASRARRRLTNRVFLEQKTDASLLRSYKYQKLKRGEDPIQRALEQHSLTKDGLAYNND